MKTSRKGEVFVMPRDIVLRSRKATKRGIKFLVSPAEIMRLMTIADRALNGDSNDAEHDALYEIRELLSVIYEDPERTYSKQLEEDLFLLRLKR